MAFKLVLCCLQMRKLRHREWDKGLASSEQHRGFCGPQPPPTKSAEPPQFAQSPSLPLPFPPLSVLPRPFHPRASHR